MRAIKVFDELCSLFYCLFAFTGCFRYGDFFVDKVSGYVYQKFVPGTEGIGIIGEYEPTLLTLAGYRKLVLLDGYGFIYAFNVSNDRYGICNTISFKDTTWKEFIDRAYHVMNAYKGGLRKKEGHVLDGFEVFLVIYNYREKRTVNIHLINSQDTLVDRLLELVKENLDNPDGCTFP